MRKIDKLKFVKIAAMCQHGKCPTIYRSEDGRYFIQGYKVQVGIRKAIGPPRSEEIVEIPSELLNQLKRLI